MDTEYHKFYRPKWIATIFSLVCAFVLFYAFNLSVPFNILLLIVVFFIIKNHVIPILKNDPYIEITPLYIRIASHEKLLWSDIDRVERQRLRKGGYVYRFCPKDVSKYNLNWFQRLWATPFVFVEAFLQAEDLKKLIEVLKEKVPNNNLN